MYIRIPSRSNQAVTFTVHCTVYCLTTRGLEFSFLWVLKTFLFHSLVPQSCAFLAHDRLRWAHLVLYSKFTCIYIALDQAILLYRWIDISVLCVLVHNRLRLGVTFSLTFKFPFWFSIWLLSLFYFIILPCPHNHLWLVRRWGLMTTKGLILQRPQAAHF
jgi:hypothetical protein